MVRHRRLGTAWRGQERTGDKGTAGKGGMVQKSGTAARGSYMSNGLVPYNGATGELEPATPSAIESLTRAEVDTQISTAKRFPRSIDRARKEALSMATLDPEVAGSCFYRLKRRGGDGKPTTIEGPSVRLAEMVAAAWGNLRYAGRIVAEEAGCVVAHGVAHDLEANICVNVEVRRRITTKDGRRYGEDMVAITCQAAISIAVRNAIFKVIPRAYVDSICREAKRFAVGDQKTLAQRRKGAVDYFGQQGISKQQLWTYLSTEEHPVRGIEDVGLVQLEDLLGLIESVREGETTFEQAFGVSRPKSNPLEGATAAPHPPAQHPPEVKAELVDAPPPQAEPEPENTGVDAPLGSNEVEDRMEQFRQRMNAATSLEELLVVGSEVESMPAEWRSDLVPVYKKNKKRIELGEGQ